MSVFWWWSGSQDEGRKYDNRVGRREPVPIVFQYNYRCYLLNSTRLQTSFLHFNICFYFLARYEITIFHLPGISIENNWTFNELHKFIFFLKLTFPRLTCLSGPLSCLNENKYQIAAHIEQTVSYIEKFTTMVSTEKMALFQFHEILGTVHM